MTVRKKKHNQAVIVFTRIPLPGQTKTRMMPYLDAEQCARLHTNFLKDIAVACRRSAADVFVYYTPERPAGILEEIFEYAKGFEVQKGDDLGQRMYVAIRDILEKGYEKCVLIGTDIPEIQAKYLKEAFAALDHYDVVFGPTADGGYYLTGMKKPLAETFEKQSYGHGSVLENTIASLESKGISAGVITELEDMDTREDLTAYRNRMRTERNLQYTYTGKYLMRTGRISIIIPVYNEEKTVGRLKEQLRGLKNHCEILFVDGESTDRTLEKLGTEYRVIHAPKGRANQMNAGAKASSGDILFFLHCDSELPLHPLEEIRQVMKDHRVGCFGVAFQSHNFFMFTCRLASNWRAKHRKIMFGDQGIFIDRDLFFEVGMFPDMPIMEDYQFSLSLKKRKEKTGITKHRIYSSDRRFEGGSFKKLAVMAKMHWLRLQYRKHVSAEKIARQYPDIR